jgi:hypothetical protein
MQQRTFQDLPLLQPEAKAEIFDSETHLSPMSYLVKPATNTYGYDKHMTMYHFLKSLYHIGSILINNGLAYTRELPEIVRDGKLIDISTNKVSYLAARDTLLNFYYKLPYCRIEDVHGYDKKTYSVNPFHALFVLKVALDHLPAEFILAYYRLIEHRNFTCVAGVYCIGFPDDSQFTTDQPAYAILSHYILNNLDRFKDLTFEEQKNLKEKFENELGVGVNTFLILGIANQNECLSELLGMKIHFNQIENEDACLAQLRSFKEKFDVKKTIPVASTATSPSSFFSTLASLLPGAKPAPGNDAKKNSP